MLSIMNEIDPCLLLPLCVLYQIQNQIYQHLIHFHEPKMPPELWASQRRQRKQRPKILIFFNRTRKRTFFLRLGIVAYADCVRSLMSPQTLIKNVQELAKEEGEESEAKLRKAIEILKGAISAIAGSWRDLWGTTF